MNLHRRAAHFAVAASSFALASFAFAQIPEPGKLAATLDGDFRTAAAQPPTKHRGPLMREVEPLLLQQARHLVSQLLPWSRDPRTALLPLVRRTPSSESGIRPNAHTAKGLALLVRLVPADAFPADFPPAVAREHALAMLRYLLRTHGASGETCDDGKPWHNQWQSAYWAALTGEASWLLWDDLTPAERWLAARMVCDEADRFVGVTPPTNLVNDSKAEENAWNSQIVSLAFSMFPSHPRHALWRETAVRWIATSFARGVDLARTDLVDGRPLREWLTGANLYDDFTLENHGRVHPDYMACTYLLSSQVPLYTWGGHTPPAALHLNVEAVNASLKRLALPDGAWIYPNGQDWGLRRNIDWFEYHTAQSVLYRDAQSAALQRANLDTMKRMAARTPRGSLYLPSETKLASDDAMALELPAHAYALMAQLGEGPVPVTETQLRAQLAGRHVFESGKFAVLRTPDSIATFSWGAQVMGQIFPLRRDQLLSPDQRGLIGYVGLPGLTREIPVAREIVLAPLSDALGVSGVLSRADGAVEQRFAFLALPDGRTIYADLLRLTGEARPTVLDLGTLGVLNDPDWPSHTGTRTLVHDTGTRTFTAADAERAQPVELHSRWFNLDGLGIVVLDASGAQRYVPSPTGAAGRLEQRFHLNAISAETLARATPAAPVAHSVLLFYPNHSPAQTHAAAARCQLRSSPGSAQIDLQLEDGTAVTFDLARSRLTLVPATTR